MSRLTRILAFCAVAALPAAAFAGTPAPMGPDRPGINPGSLTMADVMCSTGFKSSISALPTSPTAAIRYTCTGPKLVCAKGTHSGELRVEGGRIVYDCGRMEVPK